MNLEYYKSNLEKKIVCLTPVHHILYETKDTNFFKRIFQFYNTFIYGMVTHIKNKINVIHMSYCKSNRDDPLIKNS